MRPLYKGLTSIRTYLSKRGIQRRNKSLLEEKVNNSGMIIGKKAVAAGLGLWMLGAPLMGLGSTSCAEGEEPVDGRGDFSDVSDVNSGDDDTSDVYNSSSNDDYIDDIDENCTSKYPHDSTYNVVECEDIGDDWNCPYEGGECIADYLRFPEIASSNANIVFNNEGELEEYIQKILEGDIKSLERGSISNSQLKNDLRERLNINFLLTGMDERNLRVTKVDSYSEEGYNLETFLFEDLFVGEFKGMLFSPPNGDISSTIIASPGHGGALEYIRAFNCKKYFPENGYATFVKFDRAMAGGYQEDLVTRDMLLNGQTFLAVQIYENLLVSKFLKYKGVENIGAMGHSGGASILSVAVRVDEDIKAYVADNFNDYLELTGDGNRLMSSCVPQIWKHSELILDFNTAETHILKTNYGFKEFGTDRDVYPGNVIDFFNEYLRE